ncbi:MAG: O-linked N-acetylglucosamine transferase, SPINDLY family protein [Microcoleaceae cyanobacterium]
MTSHPTLKPDWQQLAQQHLINNNYVEFARLYEQAIEIESDVRSHYWNLGLAFLLQGQEAEAQTTWLLGMADGEEKEIDQWTNELVQVLQTEAERQRWESGDYKVAWVIRQHIREIQPENVNNLLHIIGLSTLLKTYAAEDLTEYGIIEQLNSQASTAVNAELLLQVINNVLDYTYLADSSYELVAASIPYIEDVPGFINILIPFIYKIAYSDKQHRLAIKFTEQGLILDPRHPELLRCLTSFYQDIGEYEQGIETAQRCYDAMVTLADKVTANALIMRSFMSKGNHWQEFYTAMEHQKNLLEELFQEKPSNLSPASAIRLFSATFFFPYFQDSPQENVEIRREVAAVAQINIERNSRDTVKKCRQWQSHLPSSGSSDKCLKIGYLSHCLKNHSVGWLARWIFQHHDHEKFKIHAYLFAAETQPSDLQQWYLTKADKAYQFAIDSEEIAEQIAEDEIDILVDLDSITLTNSCEVMAIKPAPVQVTWLGWDASSVSTVDYYIADPYVLPESAQEYYAEKIWRLPQTYIAVDGFEVGISQLRRSELGIPDSAVTYLVTQRGYKYNPSTAQLQMKILAEVPNSYFLIKGVADQEAIKTFYADIADAEGVNSDRLKLIPFSASEATHRADLIIADVVLDTYPYNGATTTMETLWMGIPLVTRVGQQFASRNSYTMMVNAGITEGIAWTDEEYIEWGIRLGRDENLRQQISWKLKKSRQTAPLWNGKQFTREMENAYQQMWKIYLDSQG